ncbi:hypothetical protein LWI28_016585 [Acer negundo]|uniref:Receptor-like serine/threonine-protein kinase n=1 Tax=Acer negundo TaxID=4023 RepID=A0AAD5J6E2_ACENE|nr:hypothetical protein LWI28_016585 [Acer negundo]
MAGFMMLIISFFLFSYITITTTLSLDTITLGQSIKDGETVVSAGEVYELGFFHLGKSSGRYLGIWYKNDGEKSVVWVANRNTPISDSSGFLSINVQGSLVLRMNSTNEIVWSSNASTTLQNPVAVLLESGNLVVKDGNDNNPDNFLWQSFDYPCDTLLPDMKLGKKLDPRGSPQLFARKGTEILYRSGSFTGTPQLEPNQIFTYDFVSNEKEVFYTFQLRNRTILSRVVVRPSGEVQRFTWIDRTKSWSSYSTMALDRCENYDLCGSYASCNINKSPDVCECLKGFTPKSPGEWKILSWTEGCVRRASLNCNHSDGFLKHEEVKLPDTSHSWVDNNISLAECKKLCLINCSCTAYANSDVREGGTGCLLWFSDLLDVRNLELNGQDLYVRVAASELGTSLTDHSGVLNVTQQGILVLLDGMNRIIWSSNTSRTAKNTVVQLLKSGNLVVKDGNDDDPGNFLWQSFDHPTDTLLPGMKLGRNFVTGLDKYLSSWKSSEDPAPGQFSLWIDPRGFPQLVLSNGSALCYRDGSWNGIRFTGTPRLNPNPEFLYLFELNKDEVYYEARILWKEGRPMELIDDNLGNSGQLTEVLRCIHVGLLCVQQRPKDRPNMSSVVLMLGSESSLPQPNEPGFFTERNLPGADQSSSSKYISSGSEITILEGR